MADRSDIVDRLRLPKWRVSHDLDNPSNPVQGELVINAALQDMKDAAVEIELLRERLGKYESVQVDVHGHTRREVREHFETGK